LRTHGGRDATKRDFNLGGELVLFGSGCSSARARVCAKVGVGEFGEAMASI